MDIYDSRAGQIAWKEALKAFDAKFPSTRKVVAEQFAEKTFFDAFKGTIDKANALIASGDISYNEACNEAKDAAYLRLCYEHTLHNDYA